VAKPTKPKQPAISDTRIIPCATVALATKLGVGFSPNEIVTVVWDIECGLHSGIPECCIAFYVGGWRSACVASMKDEVPLLRKYEKLCDRAIARGELVGKYKPCFECLSAKRFVVPTLCDCEARAEPWRRAGLHPYPFFGNRHPGCREWVWDRKRKRGE